MERTITIELEKKKKKMAKTSKRRLGKVIGFPGM